MIAPQADMNKTGPGHDVVRANQLIEAGLWLHLGGDSEGARRLFSRALSYDPNNRRAREWLVKINAARPATPTRGVPSPAVRPASAPPAAAHASKPKPSRPAMSVAPQPALEVSVVLLEEEEVAPLKVAESGPHITADVLAFLSDSEAARPAPTPAARASAPAPKPAPARVPAPAPVARPASARVPAPASVPARAPAPAPVARPVSARVPAPASVPARAPAPAPAARPVSARVPAPASVPARAPAPAARPVSARVPTPASVPVRPLTPVSVPVRPLTPVSVPVPRMEPQQELPTLLQGVGDLLSLGDMSSAMELLRKAEQLAPGDARVAAARERCAHAQQGMMEAKLGDLKRVPLLKLRMAELMKLSLDPRAGFLLSRIDGMLSFEALFAVSGMSRLDTMRVLVHLLDQNIITVR